MIAVTIAFPGIRPILPITPSTPPFLLDTVAIIAATARPTSIRKNPMNPTNQEEPVSLPRNGGKIRFPAPNCVANSARPMMMMAERLLLVLPFCSIISIPLILFIPASPGMYLKHSFLTVQMLTYSQFLEKRIIPMGIALFFMSPDVMCSFCKNILPPIPIFYRHPPFRTFGYS